MFAAATDAKRPNVGQNLSLDLRIKYNFKTKQYNMFKKIDKIKIIGYVFLITGFLLVFLHKYPKDKPFNVLINNLYANFSAEFISIAITILLINYLYELKETKNLKSRLIRELGSEEKGLSSRALKELRENGWLQDGTLKNVDLQNANLSNLDLSDANLEGVNLKDANLNGAKLIRVNLNKANLTQAKLVRSNLENCKLNETIMHRVNLSEGILNRIEVVNIDFMNSNLELIEMTDSKLVDCKFEDVTLKLTNLSRTKFINCNFLRADVHSSNIKESVFERCNISDLQNWSFFENRTSNSFLAPTAAPNDFMSNINS